MANTIDQALIAILPDFTRFDARVQARLRTIGPATIQVRIDQSQANRAISEASSRASRTVTLQARLDDREFKRQLAQARHGAGSEIELKAKLNAAQARLDLARLQTPAGLNRDLVIRARTRGVEQARRELLDLASATRRVEEAERSRADRQSRTERDSRDRDARSLKNILNSLGGRGAAFTGAAVATLLANITPAVGAVLALSSSLAVAGTAVGTFAGAAVGHLQQVTTVLKQVREQGQQLRDLPAPFRELIPAIDQFQGAWGRFLQITRVGVFDVFMRGMDLAKEGMAQFAPIVNVAAIAVGKSIDTLKGFLQGGAFQHFIATVKTEAPAAIDSLTKSAGYLSEGLLNIFSGFAPAGQTMLKTIEDLTQKFSKWTASLQGSSDFQAFVQYTKDYGPKIVDIIVQLGVMLVKIVGALAPFSGAVTIVLDSVLRLVNAIPQDLLTLIVSGFLAVKTAGLALRVLVPVFMAIKNAMVGMSVAASFSGGWAALLTKLAPAITIVGVALLAGLSIYDQWKDRQDNAAQATARHKTQVEGLSKALLESGGVITKNIRIQQFEDLSKEFTFKDWNPGSGPQGGMFAKDKEYTANIRAQAEAAQADLGKLTDGALGNKEAFDATNKSFDDYIAKLKKEALWSTDHKRVQWLEEEIIKTEHAKTEYGKYKVSVEEAAAANKALIAAGLAPQFNADGTAIEHVVTLLERYNAALAPTDTEAVAQAHEQKLQALVTADSAVKKAGLNEKNVARDTAQAIVDSDRALRDSKERLADVIKRTAQGQIDAAKAVKTAEVELAAARAAAQKALDDQANSEESADLRLERARTAAAKVGKYFGPLQADFLLSQRDAALELDEATKNSSRTKTAGDLLRLNGVEGDPGVIAARDALAKAQKDQTDQQAQASRDLRDAYEAVETAKRNHDKAITDGKQANADAHQATLDAITAQTAAKTAYDKSQEAILKINDASLITATNLSALNTLFQQQMTLDTGDVPKQLQDIQVWIEALKLMSKDVNLTASAAMTTARNNIQGQVGPASGVSTGNLTHHATGGPIYGPGTGTSDSIIARGPVAGVNYFLSNNEHIWTSDEVQGAGGHGNVEKLRAAARRGKFNFAGGGMVEDISRLAIGNALSEAGLLDQAAATYGALPKGATGDVGKIATSQKVVAQMAYAVAKAMGASTRAILALFEAGVVEAPNFHNPANSSVPESMALPHDGVGSDHDSVGFLQQRASWGSASERLNPSYAARKFLEKAIKYDKNFIGSAGHLAQKVQVSAYPDRYDAVSAVAQAYLRAAMSDTTGVIPTAHYQIGDTPTFPTGGDAGGGVTPPTGPLTGFPPWPAKHPGAGGPSGDSGVWKNIVALIKSTGPISGAFGNAYRAGDPLWHGAGRAVDWMGYQQDALAMFLAGKSPLELIHRTSKRDYAFTRGKDKGSFHESLMEAHRNHVHIAMKSGGPVLTDNGWVLADNGATLPPMSRTVVENRTSKNEKVGFEGVTQNITINNPKSEPASESLDKAIRRARNKLGG